MRARDVRGDRAVVDDPAALRVLGLHLPERGLGAEEGAGQVEVDHGPPGRHFQLLHGDGRAEAAGVVEQQVHPAVALGGRGEQRVHGRRVGDVGRQHVGRGAAEPGGLVQGLGASAGQHRPPAGRGQFDRDGAADTAPGSGDDGDLLGHGSLLGGCSRDCSPGRPGGDRPGSAGRRHWSMCPKSGGRPGLRRRPRRRPVVRPPADRPPPTDGSDRGFYLIANKHWISGGRRATGPPRPTS